MIPRSGVVPEILESIFPSYRDTVAVPEILEPLFELCGGSKKSGIAVLYHKE
jgi:hypothetical protein